MKRRDFLKDAALVVAGLGLSPSLTPAFAESLEQLASGKAPVLWLQGLACSGCSVSLLNSDDPDPVDLVTRYLSLYYHPVLSGASGSQALETLETVIARGDYLLVVEGAVPLGMPQACKVGHEPFSELFARVARSAKIVIAAGTCAAFGGVASAPPNLTGAAPLAKAMEQAGVSTPLLRLPGCPVHPARLVGNLIHLLRLGMPKCDELQRPLRQYGELLHTQCLYFADYQEKRFARNFGDPGCQFKLGCQGVITKSDCSRRKWNDGVNWCIEARGVCVGCCHEGFLANPDFPLYRFYEEHQEHEA